jgi:translation initiation factor 2 beta subunit (eIF-2beta)/eIF-5
MGFTLFGGAFMIIETLKSNMVCEENTVEYTYNLVQSELEVNTNGERRVIDVYGVEIESEVKNKDKHVERYREHVGCITPNRYKGSELLGLLRNNGVSPIHLIDIIEEYIEEYYADFDEVVQAIAN